MSIDYGMSSLMSLLTGQVVREPKQGPQQIKEEEKQTSLLDTLNLSYAGNMDISRALDQVLSLQNLGDFSPFFSDLQCVSW